MNASVRRIDARDLACPGPVLAVKKALEEGGFERLEVAVGNETAKDNVERFAAYAGHSVEGSEKQGTGYAVRIRRNGTIAGNPAPAADDEAVSPGARPTALTCENVFIPSDVLGSGSDELGALLIKGFFAALKESPRLPRRIILMNGGVKLAAEGSPALPGLKALEEKGVEVLACGTCLDYFGLKEKLAAGRVSNMFEIAAFLASGPTLRI